MVYLFSLIAAMALLQCIATGHIIKETKRDIDNQISPNVTPSPRRGLHKFVRVPEPLSLTRSPLGVVVTCHAAGNPAPIIMWMKNGAPMADYEEETNQIRSISPDSVAMVTSRLVTSAANGDVFTCVAGAGLKETSRSEMYDEEGDYESLAPAPIITESYSDVFQNLGTSLTLPCRVTSGGDYEVVWWVNDEKVYMNPRIRVLPSGDLRITNLVFTDLGNYTCAVRDIYGRTSESTFLYPTKPKTSKNQTTECNPPKCSYS